MATRGSKGPFFVGSLILSNGVTLLSGSGAPTSGASGTGAAKAAPGSYYFDYTNGVCYQNQNTKASPTWMPVAGGMAVRYAEVTLTNAQVLNLRATPITLVAAPGAGKKLRFLGASLNVNGTAGAYTEGAVNMAVRYVNGTGIIVSGTIESTGFIDQAGKMHSQAIPVIDAIATEAQAVNVPLVLHNTGGAEFGGGNAANTLKVSTAYQVIAAL